MQLFGLQCIARRVFDLKPFAMSDELAAQTALEEVAKATEESATLLLEDPPKELETPSKQSKLCQLCRRALPENAPGRLKQKTFS